MIGTYGISAPIRAQGCNGGHDTYTDAAFDAQYQYLR